MEKRITKGKVEGFDRSNLGYLARVRPKPKGCAYLIEDFGYRIGEEVEHHYMFQHPCYSYLVKRVVNGSVVQEYDLNDQIKKAREKEKQFSQSVDEMMEDWHLRNYGTKPKSTP